MLADEINRATPKTQSALLEAMEERHMTVDGVTRPLPSPFMVIATQNPIEYEGTFPLPEAQLDRFMLRLRLGYPEPMEEMLILDEQKRGHPVETLRRSPTRTRCWRCSRRCARSTSTPPSRTTSSASSNATRTHPDVYLGASPRGSLALYRASQAYAALSGRDFVIPDDVKALAEPALAHRVILKTAASIRAVDGRGDRRASSSRACRSTAAARSPRRTGARARLGLARSPVPGQGDAARPGWAPWRIGRSPRLRRGELDVARVPALPAGAVVGGSYLLTRRSLR